MDQMGLFDEFVTKGLEVACPKCGSQLDVLQTKSLPDPCLAQYHLGDKLELFTRDGLAELEIREGRLLCYTSCDACGAWSDWYAIINVCRWVAVELAGWREAPARETLRATRTE